jgi:hypothetical protein
MFTSKDWQSIALGIAMLIVWIAAAVHMQSRAQGATLARAQMDVLAMLSLVGTLPVETAPMP